MDYLLHHFTSIYSLVFLFFQIPHHHYQLEQLQQELLYVQIDYFYVFLDCDLITVVIYLFFTHFLYFYESQSLKTMKDFINFQNKEQSVTKK